MKKSLRDIFLIVSTIFVFGSFGCNGDESSNQNENDAEDVEQDASDTEPDSNELEDTGAEDTNVDTEPDLGPDTNLGSDVSELDTNEPIERDVGPHPYEDSLFLSDQFLNIAHRGGGHLWPEETILAYRSSIEAGADVIECDAHMTSDGVIICMHDDTLTRNTNGTDAVRDITLEELQQFDAGYNFTLDGGETYPHRGTGLVVPTLDEVLTEFPEAYISIELKQTSPPIVEALLLVVREQSAENRIALSSFSDDVIAEVREAEPDIITGLAIGEMLAFQNLTDETEQNYILPGHLIQIPDANALTEEFIARVHRLGMRVHVWTINEREDMERIIAMGVDGIFTDDPVLLHSVLSEE